MAKFLEEELKLQNPKHCDTCKCATKDLTVLNDIHKTKNIANQTDFTSFHCLRCNMNLNSPSHTSPYRNKFRSSESVISETKSSVSAIESIDKKRYELMVNPILGHHRMCERTKIETDGSARHTIKQTNMEKAPISKASDKIKADGTKTLTHGPGNGSTNSLWSKTSSKEGTKIFESFNLNLIKAIKASGTRFLYFQFLN